MEGQIIRELSNARDANRVYLYRSKRHGDIIKKEFADGIQFKRELEALKKIDRSLHPALYKIDMRRKHLYLSFDPIETAPDSWDACVAELMNHLHTSTRRYSGPQDPGTGEAFTVWKDFLQKRGGNAVEVLRDFKDYGDAFRKWMYEVEDSPFAPVSYIHCNVTRNNIGQRNDGYILLNLEHALLGDPYWDVACYVLEEAQSKDEFYQRYGVENPEKAGVFLKLRALERAAYYFRQRQAEKFEQCLVALDHS